MAWISVHESIDGPKLRNLYKQLGCSKFEAVGILNFLWFWGLANAEKDGRILYAEKEDIQRHLYGVGAGCSLDPNAVVDALFETGWLDEIPTGLYIHDWEIWQDQWYKAKERRENDARRKRESRRSRHPSPEAIENPEKADCPLERPLDAPEDESSRPATPRKPEQPKYPPAFEQFWSVYPRKEDKGMAHKKYRARRSDGYSDEELLAAAQAYADKCRRLKTEKGYIKHPKTFLGESLPFLEFLPQDAPTGGTTQFPDGSNPFGEYEESSQ